VRVKFITKILKSRIEFLFRASKKANLLSYLFLIPPFANSIIVFFSMNTSFECDSNTYFNFAKGLTSGDINLLRGPGYPVFLILAGVTWANSFLVILFLQWVMGVVSIYLIINLIEIKNSWLKFLFSLFFSLTGFTFFGARILLAEQLTMFFVVTSLVCFLRFRKSMRISSLFLAVLLSLGAYLTRWETMPILIGILFASVISFKSKLFFEKIMICLVLPVLVISSWAAVRTSLTDGAGQIGVLPNESGSQLMYSLNVVWSEKLQDIINQKKVNKSEDLNYFNPNNGPATQQIIEISKDNLRNDPFLFDVKYEGLSMDSSYVKEMQNIWEPAKETPWLVIDWFFAKDPSKRSTSVILMMNDILVKEVGNKKAETLMRNASLEIIKNNPKIIYPYLERSSNWFGFDFRKSNGLYIGDKTIGYWEVPLNPAACASAVLSNRQFSTYALTFAQYKPLGFSQGLTAYAMDTFRIVYSGLIFLCLLLFLFKRIRISFESAFLIIIHISLILFLSMSQVGIHSKYSILPGTLSLMSFVLLFNCILGLNLNHSRSILNKFMR